MTRVSCYSMCQLLLHNVWKLLLVCSLLPGASAVFSMPQCNLWGNIDIVQNQQPEITCTGLLKGYNIYWSITDPSGQHETRIADCSHCKQGCPPCTVITEGYNVIRELYNSTTLKFLNSSLITSGSTVKCSQFYNGTNVTCKLFVVPAAGQFSLPQCNGAGNIDIVRDQETVVTCTGLNQSQGIYWSITDQKGETVLGECDNCDSGCNRCRTLEVGYNVSRETEDTTTLKIMNSSLITPRSRLKCSERNNITEKSCTVFVVQAYRIPACGGDVITVLDMQGTPVVCEGLLKEQDMYWTLTYGNGTVSTIATCKFCQPTCPPCSISESDFTVTREDTSSTLVIQNNVRQKDGATLTCSKTDNATRADCKIRVVSLPPKTSGQKTESLFPVAAVVGSAVGGVVVVVVIVFIIVFIKRRGSRDADESITEEPVSSADDTTRTYDDLNMPDVGQPSVYAGVYSSPPDASGDVALYNGLNKAEVGQPSVYSQLGQNNTNTGDVALYNGLNKAEVGQPSVYSQLGQDNTNADVDYEVPL